MLTPQLLLTHLNYSEWASRRLLDAATSLPEEELKRDHGTSDKSVLGTLVHVFAADRHWLARVRLQDPGRFVEESDYSLEVLREQWPGIHVGWREWLSAQPEESLAEAIEYADLKGRPYATPRWQIVLHVVNHGTHHRGQAAGFLRRMGYRPQPLDLITFYRGLAT
jgi:uncharacterized damage-inducible protein DinB